MGDIFQFTPELSVEDDEDIINDVLVIDTGSTYNTPGFTGTPE